MDKKRPVADDAPAFLAPALDLRRVVELVETGSADDFEKATALALTFAIPSRPWRDPGANLGALDDGDQTLSVSPYKQTGETTVRQSPRDILLRTLLSIGPLVHLADAAQERPTEARVLVGRARAIRFRIALEEAWPDEAEPRAKKGPLDPELAFALDTAVLVMIADGMPGDEDRPSPYDFPMVKVIVDGVRARHPMIKRSAFKEAGVIALARTTLLGFSRALQYIKTNAASIAAEERAVCVAMATTLSQVPEINDYRMLALGGLRRMLTIG